MDAAPDHIPSIDPHDPEALQLLDAVATALRWARLAGADTIARSPWLDGLQSVEGKLGTQPGPRPSPARPGPATTTDDAAPPRGAAPPPSSTSVTSTRDPGSDGSAHDDRRRGSAANVPASGGASAASTADTGAGLSFRLRDRPRPVSIRTTGPAAAPGLAAAAHNPAAGPAPGRAPAARAPRPSWTLDEIRSRVDGCTACNLANGCIGRAHAKGPGRARLLIVVDGPGPAEVGAGRPLADADAQVLIRALAAAGLRLEEAHVAPIVRCAPAGAGVAAEAAAPGPEALAACARYLAAEMAQVQPDVLWIHGATAARFLLRAGAGADVPALRQRWHTVRGVDAIVSWSMADLARDPARKRDTWADLQEIQRRLALRR